MRSLHNIFSCQNVAYQPHDQNLGGWRVSLALLNRKANACVLP